MTMYGGRERLLDSDELDEGIYDCDLNHELKKGEHRIADKQVLQKNEKIRRQRGDVLKCSRMYC